MKIVKWTKENLGKIAEYFLRGEIIVLPTDTLYGVLAIAHNKEAVEMVYGLKGRNPAKPVIILIADFEDVKKFEIEINQWQVSQLNKYWPGKVSIILPCLNEKFAYLHRGTKTLAFRLPDNELLRDLIRLTGPLIAPSANPEGLEPALNVAEAKKYFGDRVALYIDDGDKHGSPSTLISLVDNKLLVLRGELPEISQK